MFDVLVYLYETYYRPDACPEVDVLAKKLSAVGFEEDEITQALDWLTDLAHTADQLSDQAPQEVAFPKTIRVYVPRELAVLDPEAIGFLMFLESANVLTPWQREIVVERALAACNDTISLDKLKVIVLMVLWSQGKEPDGLIFDELFFDDEDDQPRLLH